MRVLLEQIDRAVQQNLYLLALFGSLTLPDICGAMDAADGRASGARYRTWYAKWVSEQQHTRNILRVAERRKITKREDERDSEFISRAAAEMKMPYDQNRFILQASSVYFFRCSLLHQGRAQHPNLPVERIAFIEPGSTKSVLHNVNVGKKDSRRIIVIDVRIFCQEIVHGVRAWLEQVENTPLFQTNYEKYARRHPDGFEPIRGVPVIG